MMRLRKSAERGFFDHGWLRTYHSFSFGDYIDRKWMGFRTLRVINEDWVAAGAGFPPHSHRDMEIVTYVLKGALAHKDSMGNASAIRPGEVQRMTAGSGVTHSEFNHAADEAIHLLQIWIFPDKKSLEPGYEQKAFSPAGKLNALRLVAAPVNGSGSASATSAGSADSTQTSAEKPVSIHQDARIYDSHLEPGRAVKHDVKSGRAAWIQVISGSVRSGGVKAKAGDALYTEDIGPIEIEALPGETPNAAAGSDFLLFDVM